MFLGLLTGGYVASPLDDAEIDSTWLWDSEVNATFRPLQAAWDSTTTWSSSMNLTVPETMPIGFSSTWTWSSEVDIDEGALGPRARARRAGAGGDRDTPATAGSSTRGTPGTPGSGAGR